MEMTKEEARLIAEAFYEVKEEKRWEQHIQARKVLLVAGICLTVFFAYGFTFWGQ